MRIYREKKEVHIVPLSIEKLAKLIEYIRSKPIYNDFKIMIDGFNENTTPKRTL